MMDKATTRHQEQDGRADFDFEVGRWQVHSRRLRQWLRGSTAWEEFEGISVARKVLGGLGMIDEITNERASGPTQGMTVRLFDPQTQQWSIYFADSVHGTLTTPLIGGFKHGRGEFYAYEPIAGKHLFSRFLWLDITDTSYRWEQAFSADGGSTWETNWIQEHSRLQE
jgi:hypothetical protein